MKVFLSWSGDRSKAVATALHGWLKDVIQSLEPFISSEDIDKGAQGLPRISEELAATDFGIICLTRENLERPWINFEAGSLSKAMTKARVMTYLIDVPSTEVRPPLSLFQWTEAQKKDENFKLLKTVNAALPTALSDEKLKHAFDKWWPDLEKALKELPPASSPPKPKRDTDDVLGEILTLVRQMAGRREPIPIESQVRRWLAEYDETRGDLPTKLKPYWVATGKPERRIEELRDRLAYTQGQFERVAAERAAAERDLIEASATEDERARQRSLDPETDKESES